MPGARRIPGSAPPPMGPDSPAGASTGPIGAPPPLPSLENRAADPTYGSRQRSYVSIFPAWDPGVREFYVQSDITTIPAATPSFVLLEYIAPNRTVGYVRGFGQDGICGSFVDAAWQLVIGGQVVQTFKPIGQVGTFLRPATMAWPYAGGQRIQVLVSTAASGWDLAAMLHLIEKNLDNVMPERF